MALKNFKFGFGDGFQEVALPEEHILQVLPALCIPTKFSFILLMN